jgi:NTE family protein
LFRSQEWLSLLTDRKNDLKDVPLSEEDGVTYIFGFPVSRKKRKEGERPMIGMLNGDQIVLVLDSMMQRSGYIQFDTLPIPFRCVAVDISGPDEVVLKEGELAKAMRASMAIPGAFKAVEWGDKTLVDGGMINNLPVDVVRAMGADIVIAIDLSNEQHESRDFSLKDLVGIGGILDWAVSRPDWKKHNDNRADADVLITPNLECYDVMSFSLESISDMIARGERAARQVKPQLLKLKQ